MCTVNSNIKGLRKMRAQGHVLIRGYKYVTKTGKPAMMSCFPALVKGWNRARVGIDKRVAPMRTKPYSKGHWAGPGCFHVCTEKDNWYIKQSNERQQAVWFYADEILAMSDTPVPTIAVRRVFIKRLAYDPDRYWLGKAC